MRRGDHSYYQTVDHGVGRMGHQKDGKEENIMKGKTRIMKAAKTEDMKRERLVVMGKDVNVDGWMDVSLCFTSQIR